MKLNLLTCLLIVGLLFGCQKKDSQQPTSQPAGGKPAGVIGISVLTMTNPFFKEIADTVRDEAAKSGYETIIVSGEFDPARQYQQVKDFIVKKVSVIILTPCDSKAVGTAIKEANEAGIPVFTADIACLAKDVKVVCHVATDNYSGGRQAAKAIMQALGNKGKVAVIDLPEVESVLLRTRGFKDELQEAKSPIEIVTMLPGKGSKDESFKTAQEILNTYPDLNGIFAINDPSALGAVAAVEIAKKSGKVVIIGFDGQPEGKKAILEGKIFADPIQYPDRIGRQVVQTIMTYLDGKPVPPQILIPTELYYQADAQKELGNAKP